MDDVLRRAPLFRELDDEAAAALRASMVESSPAARCCSEGDEGDRVYVVIAGKIKLRPDVARRARELAGPAGPESDVR